jgi:flagellar protein FlaI
MKAYRRVISVDEIADYEDYRTTFKWKPRKDNYSSLLKNGAMLPAISERTGISIGDLIEEIQRRENVLRWMRERKMRSYKDVAAIITEYYSRPEEFYEKEVGGPALV